MAYLSNSDIESLLGETATIELTDDSGVGTINADVVTAARIGAEGEANSYFATRYRVPIDTTGEPDVAAVIRSFTLDLAIYRLHSRKPPIPEDIIRRRQEAITWLTNVAIGRVRLPSVVALNDDDPSNPPGNPAGPTRVMTRESLEDV
ncbi:MAG TPA: DUF1320 domain-containing protein [Phycisphaerae bacterium]|nr:DUF1320 domain-containing protein [Phycisphaerae bacterium]HRW53833.1 DUF1320 domain-containing protein [Phycisphaerae bacterium]